jgi:hypothetical protein
VTRSGAVFGGRIRRQDKIDLNRDGRRCGNDSRLRVCDEGLGRGRKDASLDPRDSLPGGVEDSNAGQRHRFGKHADDEKFVFGVVRAVVASDNLGFVNWTDQNRGRSVTLRGPSG